MSVLFGHGELYIDLL